ncbi:MAG: hypothetical protein ACFE8Z_09960 [Candidatus Hermodarchaeota archaeon]
MGIAGPEALEGYISIGWPEEFEPAITDIAKQFKADYIAKYGECNYPEIVTANEWWILKAALQEAGSVDVEKGEEISRHILGFMRRTPVT